MSKHRQWVHYLDREETDEEWLERLTEELAELRETVERLMAEKAATPEPGPA